MHSAVYAPLLIMKSHVVTWLALAGSVLACTPDPKIGTPEVVLRKFSQLYPNATEVEWELEDALYEASFRLDTLNKSVAFMADGTMRVMETEITIEMLPRQVKEYVASHTGGQPIDEAAMIIFSDGLTQFEAGAGDKDFLFDAAGIFVSMEREEDPREDHYVTGKR